ncbi:MAG: hypothetical protein CVU59_05615, partial [Deltaproteobacteria bacterium HGW-Deltaproteobacteria-17]
PPELAGRIFEPFFTTKDPGKGTGLGLSVCRMLAGRAGGALTCLPGGEGGHFVLEIPAGAGTKASDGLESPDVPGNADSPEKPADLGKKGLTS